MTTDYTKRIRPGGTPLRPTTARDDHGQIVWLLRCDCGREFTSASMKTRKTYACPPCVNEANTGRKRISSDALYPVWNGIKQRCHNPNLRSYKDYGGRGISICPEWEYNYVAFKEYVDTLGPAPSESHTLDRINNDGNYEQGNLRWASKFEQTHNRRNSKRKVD